MPQAIELRRDRGSLAGRVRVVRLQPRRQRAHAHGPGGRLAGGKVLLEQVIRRHLGWLVVWGNVFGAIIGVLTLAFGYGQPRQ